MWVQHDVGIQRWRVCSMITNQSVAGSNTLQKYVSACSENSAQEQSSKNGWKLSLHKFSHFQACKSKQGFQEAERVKEDRCLSLSRAVWRWLVHTTSVFSPLCRAGLGGAALRLEKASASDTTAQNCPEGQLGALGHKGEMWVCL